MPSHDLLVLWTQLAALLLTARMLGWAATRVGQPVVVGELAAGLLLGPSVFGHLYPFGFRWLFPRGGGSTGLAALTAISLAGLLVAIGAETDLPLIRRLGRAAVWVAVVSFLVPVAAGAGVAALLPRSLIGAHGGRVPFVIIVAGAVAVSSLPVIAKIVADLGLVRRNVGQLAIATGTSHDALGFLLVALATGLAGSGGSSAATVAVALVGVAGVSVVVLTFGQRLIDAFLRRVRRHGPNVTGSLSVCIIGSLAAAAAMQAFGVEGALGAFVAGVALGRSRFQLGRAVSVLNTMTATLFAPLYFSTAGVRVDLGVLRRGDVAVAFGILVAVAAVAKFAGAALGGMAAGMHRREVVALGVVLNGRGALQVVLATAGLGAGVLTTASYTVLILMALVISLAVPPSLRAALGGWAGTAEEQERLGREEQLQRNVVVRGQRLLLASSPSRSSIVAAEVAAAAWPPETAVTVLSVHEPSSGAAAAAETRAVLDVLAERPVEHRIVLSESLADQILAESNLGYGAVALGAPDEPSPEHLLSPVLDELLMRSPLPLIIVRRALGRGAALPPAFSRVLVPVSGTPWARAAQEVACNLSLSLGTEVVLAHVVTRGDGDSEGDGPVLATVAPGSSHADAEARSSRPASAVSRSSRPGPPRPSPAPPSIRQLESSEGAAQVVLRAAWETAVGMGVDPEMIVRQGGSAGDEILAAADEISADVVAMGTTVRHIEGRPFLGHTVEQVLASSRATVVVVALPDQASRLGSVIAEGTD